MKHFIAGNQVSLLSNGAEYFPALVESINQAKIEIYLQTYIYELDDTGELVSAALKNAAIRGVSVMLLLDGFGCRKLPKKHISQLKASGVEVLFFRPQISPWTFKLNRLRRMHNKVAVMDGRVGYVGGINIVDDYNTQPLTPPRIDYAVKVEGFILKSLHANARQLWRKVCNRQLVKAHRRSKILDFDKHPSSNMRAAFLMRDNVKHRRDIENAYLSAIASAQSEVIIANAYFLPGLRFRHALRDAAARGVTITLLLQKRTEYMLLDFAMRGLYSTLLNQGVNIYEYHKSFMHSKVAVFDSQCMIVGSSNIDPFSLFLSLEANVIVEDKALSKQLKNSLSRSINNGSTLITVDEWQKHHYIKRSISWMAYGLVKLMIGLVGNPENTY